MTWLAAHKRSEESASAAENEYLRGNAEVAVDLYRSAAEFELQAFQDVPRDKTRTLGILAVSAAALLMKSDEYERAEKFCVSVLANISISDYFASQIREILQRAWAQAERQKAGISFLPEKVVVSIKGGSVIYGAAPLDLIVDKIQTIQSIFYRLIELVQQVPFRKSGAPSREIQEMCRPWLFQEVPGSFQFSVAMQEPAQTDLFAKRIEPAILAAQFLDIVKAASSDTDFIDGMVPDQLYKKTFLKLSRNLAPAGKKYNSIELKSERSNKKVTLTEGSREIINQSIKKASPKILDKEADRFEIKGILRAVHLDKDWLEIVENGELRHVTDVFDTVDDVIGPMVNKSVIVSVNRSGSSLKFIDVELDE